MKIIHQKADRSKMSLAQVKNSHKRLAAILPKDEYAVITTYTDLTMLDENANISELINSEDVIFDTKELIPDARELYKMYKDSPIANDINKVIIQIISDFKESLKQGCRTSSTKINRALNDNEKDYITRILIEKGYKNPNFYSSRISTRGESPITIDTTTVKMIMYI